MDDLRNRLLDEIRAIVLSGDITLSSGKKSNFYIDMRLLTLKPSASYLISNLLADKLSNKTFDAIGGLSIGADPIVGAFCYHASISGIPINGFLIRKEAKGHGTKKMIEGPKLTTDSKVILIDDVVTTGGSTIVAYDAVKETGATIVGAIAIVDREEGGREKIESLGIDFDVLFTKSELI